MDVPHESGGSPPCAGRAVEQPAAIATLDSLCAASVIAHETIFELERRIKRLGIESDESSQILAESATITTQEIPAATAEAHRLVREWGEQALLNPSAAPRAATRLSVEVAACEPIVRAFLDRQRELAVRLRSILAISVD